VTHASDRDWLRAVLLWDAVGQRPFEDFSDFVRRCVDSGRVDLEPVLIDLFESELTECLEEAFTRQETMGA
jgi:hypothetical protein